MSSLLFDLKSKIRYSHLGCSLVDEIQMSPFSDVLYKFLDACYLSDSAHERRHPSLRIQEEMKEARKFFQANESRVAAICASFEDNKSIDTYKKAILYRQTLNIKYRPPFSIHDQYFPSDIVDLGGQEVFVDCGAYVGDTINRFLRLCGHKYKRIVAFEPDLVNGKKIASMNVPRLIQINAGVWSKAAKLKFDIINHVGWAKIDQTKALSLDNSNAVSTNSGEILVQAIDETEPCRDCTFIKMDIEGSEMNALVGARKTIERMRPKLAICIYHSDEDMLRIPEWILNLHLDYKLFVRHHFGARNETVAYAIPK